MWIAANQVTKRVIVLKPSLFFDQLINHFLIFTWRQLVILKIGSFLDLMGTLLIDILKLQRLITNCHSQVIIGTKLL